MATVGRVFGFYIKYWEQMEAMYRSENQALLSLLPNGEEGSAMVKAVGKRADTQAARLLKDCASEMEGYFSGTGLCKVRPCSLPSTIETQWYSKMQVWPRGTGKKRVNHYTGVAIDRLDGTPALLFYLWVRGGRAAEEALARKLGRTVIRRSSELVGWGTGSVIFGSIPLSLDDHKRFEIKKEPLLEKTRGVLNRILNRHIRFFLQT